MNSRELRVDYAGKNITELHWLSGESNKTELEKKATMCERQLRELIRSDLFPKQIFKVVPQEVIDHATR